MIVKVGGGGRIVEVSRSDVEVSSSILVFLVLIRKVLNDV